VEQEEDIFIFIAIGIMGVLAVIAAGVMVIIARRRALTGDEE
jgi:hypothetical protein